MEYIFLLHLLVSLMMTGLIWFVQVVHYPLFAEVPAAVFIKYEGRHQRLTSYVVAPLMLAELGSGFLMLWQDASGLGVWLLRTNLLLLLGIWGSTFFIQMPMHRALGKGFSSEIIQNLVRSNWIRTVLWTLRAGILLILLHDFQ